jgi:hypothetical protein
MLCQHPSTARTAIGLTCRSWPGIVTSYADYTFWNKNRHFSDVGIHKFAIEYVVNTSKTVSVPIGAGAFSASVSGGKGKINSTFQSVTEQSGIRAGDGGFDIVVKGNTDLKAGVITSTAQASLDNRNSLITGSLTQSSLENTAQYSASTTSLTLSYSGEQKDKDGKTVLGKDGKPEQSGYQGFNGSPPIALSAKGNATSTTSSGISANSSGPSTLITDEDAQKAKTGRTAAETVASINPNVATGLDTSNALAPIFKESEIRAGFAIVQTMTQELGTFMVNRAQEADAKAQEAKDKDRQADDKTSQASQLPEGQQRDQLLAEAQALKQDAVTVRLQVADMEGKWGSGGTYRQLITAATAAISGNVASSSSQFVQSTLINLVQSKAATGIKQLADDLGIAEGSPAHAALHAINACMGAAAQGASCAAGAIGASSASVVASLLEGSAETLTNEQKQARQNLIATLVTGVAAANNQAAAANTAALIEMENNSNIKNAVKAAVSEAKDYLGKKGKDGLEKAAELLEKLEVKSLVDKQKDIAEFLNKAVERGGLTETEIVLLGTLYAANAALFPTSALDLIPGAGKAVAKTGDLVKAGIKAEDAAGLAMKEAKAAGLVGEYGKVGGHHVHAKSGFKEAVEYDPRKGFAVSQEFMDANKLNHADMTSKQRQLFKELEQSGKPNTIQEHTRIAVEALRAGGASGDLARNLVAESLRNLRNQGARSPSNIPWSKQ